MITYRTSLVADGIKISIAVSITFVIATYINSRNVERALVETSEYANRLKLTIPGSGPLPCLPKTESKFSPDYYEPEDILFFTTGQGNASRHQHKLPCFVRSQLAKPSKKFLTNYKNWNNVDYSLFQASPKIDKLIKGKKGGFFIECGGVDGFHQSTSVFFELTRNWSGLLIEGNLGLRPNILTSGRNTYILNACLSTRTIPMWVEFNNAWGGGGLQSYVGHFEKGKITPVTCYPFNSIMDAMERTHIDLFILDVQGPEVEILKTIDLKKYRIDVIIAEHDPVPANATVSSMRINKFRQFFHSTGIYQEVNGNGPNGTFNGFDILFRRKDFQVGM